MYWSSKVTDNRNYTCLRSKGQRVEGERRGKDGSRENVELTKKVLSSQGKKFCFCLKPVQRRRSFKMFLSKDSIVQLVSPKFYSSIRRNFKTPTGPNYFFSNSKGINFNALNSQEIPAIKRCLSVLLFNWSFWNSSFVLQKNNKVGY